MASSIPALPPVFTDGTVPTVAQLNALSTASAYGTQMGFDGAIFFGPAAALTIPATTSTLITWSATRQVTGNGVAMYTANSSSITIQTPGLYQFEYQLGASLSGITAAGTGMLANVYKNGTSMLHNWSQSVGSSQQGIGLVGAFVCAAGDAITASFECSTATTLPIAGGGPRGTAAGADWAENSHTVQFRIKCICPGPGY